MNYVIEKFLFGRVWMTVGSDSAEGRYHVAVKTAWIVCEREQLRSLMPQLEQEIGCQAKQEGNSITLVLGRSNGIQLVLNGDVRRSAICFYSAKVLGNCTNEDGLLELLDWICRLQADSKDRVSLLVSGQGKSLRPLVIQNGEIYDQYRVMDILWEHFAATRVRESRRIEEMYHFLRDVPLN